VIISVGGESNAAALLFRKDDNGKSLVKGWDEVYAYRTWEKKRDWQRKANSERNNQFMEAFYEHEVTPKLIRALNRKEQDATQD
jgi:hypothetical protein